MTVTLTITPAKILTRGWPGALELTIENTGDENIRNLFVKIDSAAEAIFSVFKVKGVGWYDCLNTFSSDKIYLSAAWVLPAGQSKTFDIDVTVKSDAPLGAHSLTWYVQYEVY